jgi:endonuclease YncB( thermonuclease family)
MATSFSFPIMSIVDVYDGDSFTCVVDLGFNIMRKVQVRVDGVDTPEMTGESKVAATVVRDAVKAWLERRLPYPRLLSRSLDKYGRVLGEVVGTGTPPSDEAGQNSLYAFLMTRGLAKPYKGEAKQPWTAEELAKIAAFKA